jgi:hypothetical protein
MDLLVLRVPPFRICHQAWKRKGRRAIGMTVGSTTCRTTGLFRWKKPKSPLGGSVDLVILDVLCLSTFLGDRSVGPELRNTCR